MSLAMVPAESIIAIENHYRIVLTHGWPLVSLRKCDRFKRKSAASNLTITF